MKISITRALAKLKTLKSQIESNTIHLDPFATQRGSLLLESPAILPEDFCKKAKEEAQSLKDLIELQTVIKNAIDKSNLVTIVTIGGKEMTIQEALNMKLFLPAKETLLKNLQAKYLIAQKKYEAAIKDNERTAQDWMEKSITSTGSKAETTKVSKEAKENMLKVYSEMLDTTAKVIFHDPANTAKYIETLKKEIEDFKHEVDYVLSESNSTTFIELPD